MPGNVFKIYTYFLNVFKFQANKFNFRLLTWVHDGQKINWHEAMADQTNKATDVLK